MVHALDVAVVAGAPDCRAWRRGTTRDSASAPTDGGPVPGPHNYYRAGPLAVFDHEARATIAQLDGRIDTAGAINIWNAAVASSFNGPDVWVHGDLARASSSATIDFASHRLRPHRVADPACDLAPVLTTFDGTSRRHFKQGALVDDDTWARARRWAL